MTPEPGRPPFATGGLIPAPVPVAFADDGCCFPPLAFIPAAAQMRTNPGRGEAPMSRTGPRMRTREAALRAAVDIAAVDADAAMHPHPVSDLGDRVDEVLHAAAAIHAWLTAPVRLRPMRFGPVTDQAAGRVIHPSKETGDLPMGNLQLGDNQLVTATVVADDADNYPTSDTLTWTASPADAVVLTPSADTLSCVVAGAVPTPGVVVTATDPNGLTVSGNVDVVSGPAAALSLSFGAVTAQPAPAASTIPAPPAAPAA